MTRGKYQEIIRAFSPPTTTARPEQMTSANRRGDQSLLPPLCSLKTVVAIMEPGQSHGQRRWPKRQLRQRVLYQYGAERPVPTHPRIPHSEAFWPTKETTLES